MKRAPATIEAPWARSPEALLTELGVERERGLEPERARHRLAQFGPNALRAIEPRSAWKILVHQLRSVIVLLLAIGAGIAFALAQWVEGAAILAVVVINTVLGFVTELRAVRSMEGLRKLGVHEAVVRRGGVVRRIPAQDLVPGDLVVIEGGDVVSADLRLIEASRLQVNEAPLTGESVPVAKTEDALEPSAPVPLAERSNMLFKGTVVTRGAGLGVVTATGHQTELGRISDLVAAVEERETPLEKRLDALGRRLMWASLAFAVAIAGVGVASGRELIEMLEVAIALAVATVPEGLPLVATLALARGMWRMARRNALIEELAAVETLGSANLILTDKTGTLTENRMAVARIVDHRGVTQLVHDEAGLRFERDGEPLDPREDPLLAELLRSAALCTDASLDDQDGVGDPMEVALLRAARDAGFDLAELRRAWPELRAEAFDPRLKMMATFHEQGEEQGEAQGDAITVAVKGATEAVLEHCEQLVTASGEQPLGAEDRRTWADRAEELGASGFRVLAIARKAVTSVDAEPYAALSLLGLVALEDPPRPAVRPAVAALHQAGIRVVVVTGDQATTARAIAEAVGLLEGDDPEQVQSAGAPPAELVHASVIARTSPEQKLDLLAHYQEAGNVVAMIGDGVNDAPALQQADIGVAMGHRGTQAAREAAEVILQDDEFSTIVVAIEQGRIIFDNIRKFVVYLISCNLSEILIVGIAALAGAPLPILPLQILFLNLVTGVFPALALGVSEGSSEVMRRPPRPAAEPLLNRSRWLAVLAFGALLTTVVLGGFWIALEVLELDDAGAVSIAFLVLAFAHVVHVFNLASPASGAVNNEVTRNPWVWGAVVLCVALVLAAVYVPGLSSVLQVGDPGARGWTLVVAASLIPLVLGQLGRALVGWRG
ncbi:MAG: cation-transporting P-type ATPase [Enhygromyxa sp.]